MNDLKSQIKAHAEREYPRECCGLVKSRHGVAYAEPCENIASNPEYNFEIHPRKILEEEFVAYYHSHPMPPDEFSESDKAQSDAAKFPLFLYCVKTGTFDCYRSRTNTPELRGRPFIYGVNDCVTLVIDFYSRHFRKFLTSLDRSWENLTVGIQSMRSYLSRNNLIKTDLPRSGDIVLMSTTGNGRVNHAGILWDGELLHQLFSMTSRAQVYGPQWKAVTVAVVRHDEN